MTPKLEEIDIYRTAKLIIDQYGTDAPIDATRRLDVMKERDDFTWTRFGINARFSK